MLHQAYRCELDPRASQTVLLAKHAGTARFAIADAGWSEFRRMLAYKTV